jgi:hypothetical protein
MKTFKWFVHAPIGQACPLVLAGRLAAILTVPLLSLFIISLAAENQRSFILCRLAGSPVDACLLSIHGPKSF